MKKIKWLFVMVVFVVVGAVCIAFIVKNEKNKQAPIERYYEKNESEEDNEKDHTGESKKENQTDSNDFTDCGRDGNQNSDKVSRGKFL